MTRFIRILTVGTIMVHASVGCCAHEGLFLYGGACGDSDLVACHHADKGDETCDHALAEDHTSDDQSKQPTPHECDHAQCIWSAPELRDCDQFQML